MYVGDRSPGGGLMRYCQCRYMWGFSERQAVLKNQSTFEGDLLTIM